MYKKAVLSALLQPPVTGIVLPSYVLMFNHQFGGREITIFLVNEEIVITIRQGGFHTNRYTVRSLLYQLQLVMYHLALIIYDG